MPLSTQNWQNTEYEEESLHVSVKKYYDQAKKQ